MRVAYAGLQTTTSAMALWRSSQHARRRRCAHWRRCRSSSPERKRCTQAPLLRVGRASCWMVRKIMLSSNERLAVAAGIDPTVFSACCFCPAGASREVQGKITLDKVMQIGRWASATTVNKHYLRYTSGRNAILLGVGMPVVLGACGSCAILCMKHYGGVHAVCIRHLC